jgi:PHD/YefM family antitoxin component YafN of YafNO toxin-antitoxin module
MKKVSSAEMAKRFSMYCDLALNAPIVVTKNGRDRLVMLGVDEYNFLQDLVQKSGKSAKSASKSAAKPQIRPAKKTGHS